MLALAETPIFIIEYYKQDKRKLCFKLKEFCEGVQGHLNSSKIQGVSVNHLVVMVY